MMPEPFITKTWIKRLDKEIKDITMRGNNITEEHKKAIIYCSVVLNILKKINKKYNEETLQNTLQYFKKRRQYHITRKNVSLAEEYRYIVDKLKDYITTHSTARGGRHEPN